jgi:excisionase family DNA binding protein
MRGGIGMDEYLTIFEVAEITKYTVGTLRKFVIKRRIPLHKWGRVLRFKKAEIELWMKSGCKEAIYIPDEIDGDTAVQGGTQE